VNAPAVRVVSLVPSVTETLLALGVRPVACTRFCDAPGVATVGGTKNPDVDAVAALAPDLVVVNDEENRIEDAERLRAAGVRLHDMSPRTVADVAPAVAALCDALGVDAPTSALPVDAPRRGRAFVATWRRPWMTLNADTYGSSVLAAVGWDNAFGAAATRYPEVTLDDVAACAPDLVVLPDEPYRFTEHHVPEVENAVPNARVVLVDGRDLFWWGIRTPAAIDRLREALA
jgi:ABC-type Fe3+-hydroxamate transport system substrate-binding protein